MSLADRLRGIVRPAAPRSSDAPGTSPSSSDPPSSTNASPVARPSNAADVLGGDWHDEEGRRVLVVDRRYSPGHRHGRLSVADVAPSDEGWRRLHLLLTPGSAAGPASRGPAYESRGAADARDDDAAKAAGRLLFVDLETTGLAGGAGTYAFLVGCAWFDGMVFRIRQFFLASYLGERALWDAVRDVAGACATVVTYNGKTFDLPLIDTRYVLHRMRTPFADLPHVDMLHPARRMWRPADEEDGQGGCRLSALEETLCGHQREGDVPGFEIPARYFHYVRTGDARGLEAVLEHNRLDLLSLAWLTARAAQLLDEGATAADSAREALGLGCLYERGGMMAEARAAFTRAVTLRGDETTLAEAWRALATLCRRERRYEEAADAWRRLLTLRRCPPAMAREAAEALAVHHEHRLRDPRAARTFALESLRMPASAGRQQALQHRLARLNRKLGTAASGAAPLF